MIHKIDIGLSSAILGAISSIAAICAIIIAFVVPKEQLKGKIYIVIHFITFSLLYLFAFFDTEKIFPNATLEIYQDIIAGIGGIVLFLFIQLTLVKNYKLKGWHFFILTPLVVSLFMLLISLFNTSMEMDSKTLNQLSYLTDLLYVFLVLLICFKTLRSYKRLVLQTESGLERYQYDWIRFLLYATIIFYIFPTIWNGIMAFTSIPMNTQFNFIIGGLVIVTYLLSILIKTLHNFSRTTPINISKETAQMIVQEKQKEPSALHQKVYKKMVAQIEGEKLYRNPELNLSRLAEIIGTPPRTISESINYCFKDNFYQFINSFRIREAVKILKEHPDPKLTIAEVMYEVGYNSKSSFNTTFKKIIGETPSSFRTKYLSEISSST